MVDAAWLANQAKPIHDFFVAIFYGLSTVLLLLGIVLDYFKFPLGGSGLMLKLVGRVLIAAILLHSYAEVSNTIAEVTDAISKEIGGVNDFTKVLDKYSDYMDQLSFSWTSIKDSIIMLISFFLFFLLYLSVFLADAGIIFVWTILYTFSPLLIALFILPATASATSSLYRSLFEVCAWKIVWTVLAALLWRYGISGINQPSANINIITVLALNLILAAALLLTPKMVHALTKGGLSAMAGEMAGIGAAASMLNPGTKMLSAVKKTWGATKAGAGMATSAAARGIQNRFFPSESKKKTINEKIPNDRVWACDPRPPSDPPLPKPPEWVTQPTPPHNEPPHWVAKRLEKENKS